MNLPVSHIISRKSFITLLLFFYCLITGSQPLTGLIKGQVIDAETKEALAGVNVIFGKNKGVTTNTEGKFLIEIATGTINIFFTFIGYLPVNKTIQVNQADTTLLLIMLKPNIKELEEVVVSVSKTEEKISELTTSIATLSSDDLDRNHTINVDEYLNKISGVEILDGQASIRGGSGYSYGAGSRVLVLIDGLPALSADASHVKWHFLPVENVSKIEIIKGASSVIYGSSALNGVINLRTSKAYEKPVTKISLISAIYDKPKRDEWKWWSKPRTFSNASLFHGKKKGSTSYTMSCFILNENGYRKDNNNNLGRIFLKLDHQSKQNEALNYGINLNAMYTVKKDFVLWLNADSGALIQNPQTVLELKGFAFTADPYFTFFKNNRYKHELLSRFQTSVNRYPHDQNRNDNDAYSLFTEYRFWYNAFEKFKITLGITQTLSSIISNFYQNHHGFNYAGYTQFNIYPFKKFKAIAGIRLDQYKLDGNKDKIKPIFRAGINYQLLNYTFIRASFGQGYRFPSIAEKHAFTSVGTVNIFPNPEIKAESGWSTELGIKQGIRIAGWIGQADIAAFYSQNINLIEYAFGIYILPETEISDYGFKAMNTENSRIYGLEHDFALRKYFGDLCININGGYNYMHPVEFNPISSKTSEVYLKYRSKHTFKLTTGITYKRFELCINGKYKSKTLNIDNVFLHPQTREQFLPGFYEYWTNNNKGYSLLDGFIAYRISQKSSLSVNVKNIFNAEYMGRPGDIRPQRNFSVKYQLGF